MADIDAMLKLAEDAWEERFIRASGPGGQNVNKVATAVQLRLNIDRLQAMPEGMRARLSVLAGRRLSADGVLIIDARRFRTQERNRQDARMRLAHLLEQASVAPKPRRATSPTLASKRRRLEDKQRQAKRKRERAADDD